MKKIIVPLVVSVVFVFSCKDDKSDKEQKVAPATVVETTSDTDSKVSKDKEIPTKLKTKKTPRASITQNQLQSTVVDFQNCKANSTDRLDCRNKITAFISRAYKLDEFKDAEGNYVVYDSIQPIISRSTNWENIGNATSQSVIYKAANHANKKGLALIIDTSNSYGQVVVVQSGTTKKSSSWGMELPNVLSLANHNPFKSFYNKSMAYAFKKSEDLQVYIRK